MQSFLMLVCWYILQEVLYSLRGIVEAVVAGRISLSNETNTFRQGIKLTPLGVYFAS